MLPECRTIGDPYPIPKFLVENNDIISFAEELKGFHGEFYDCFKRSESRNNFYSYMVGQFSELERKSIEPIALNVENGNVRSMQRFVSDVVWDEEKILSKYHNMVNSDMNDPNGVIIFDESGFVKKGNDSVGVAKQYCGSIGKVENSQVGVFTGYASRYGYSLLDKRLFIPVKWFDEEYGAKREKCKVPEDLSFKTKPELASEMFKKIYTEGKISFKYVTADSLYGNSPEFISTIESATDCIYFVSIPFDTKCWLKEPKTRMKEYFYRGEKKSKLVLEKTEKKPITIESLAKNINNYFWYRRKVSEGTKGPIEYEFTRKQIVLSKDGLPDKHVCLIIKRTIEKDPTYSYHISNAPKSTQLKIFVWLSGMRWPIEQAFEETKSELGMDQYEVRKYMGWHHHILTCMLGHFFLWHLKIRMGKKSTSYYRIAA